MARKFDKYRISQTDEVLRLENEIHEDLDIRLDKLETNQTIIDQAAGDAVDRVIKYAEETIAPKAAELDALLNAFSEGVETVTAEVVGIVRGDVATRGDTLAKLLGIVDAVLALPALGEEPTAPTPAIDVDSDRVVNVTALRAAISALIGGATPATLDTLNELAAALGNNANFAATITTLLAGKQAGSAVLSNLSSIGATLATGDTLYATAANTLARLAKGTDGMVLAQAAGIPAWTNISGRLAADQAIALGGLLVGTGANVFGKLAVGTNGQILTVVSGAPAWAAAPTGGVPLDVGAGAIGSFSYATATSNVSAGSTVTGSALRIIRATGYADGVITFTIDFLGLSGTWRALTAVANNSVHGMFQRIA